MAKPGIGEKGDGKATAEPQDRLTEAELASDLMGNNRLQGDDQDNVRNERHAVPGAKLEPDASPVESFKMLDKDTRAENELGKGARRGDANPGSPKGAA